MEFKDSLMKELEGAGPKGRQLGEGPGLRNGVESDLSRTSQGSSDCSMPPLTVTEELEEVMLRPLLAP